MSMVCTCLRDACRSDHLWENHINQKWGTIVGDFAFKEWQWHLTKLKSEEEEEALLDQNCSLGSFCGSCPLPCTGSYLQDFNQLRTFLPNNSMLALYFSLQGGKFWFPAQFYRGARVRDALFRYDSTSETFTAREQRVGGRWLLWKGIMWERLRLSPVATPPCFCHVSDCLEDLKPGDHIEIQGKKKSDPHYEWFYAVIGHLDSCNENEEYCCCRHSETLIVEFREYPQFGTCKGWLKLLRHDNGEPRSHHRGIYHGGRYHGGIRKLQTEEEIEKWMKHLSI